MTPAIIFIHPPPDTRRWATQFHSLCLITPIEPEAIALTSKVRFALLLAGCLTTTLIPGAEEPPRISKSGDSGQLLVNENPYLILGGELGNSSAGTAAEADSILPRVAQLHVNTVLMPVAWEQIEPAEGSFDFSILD